MKVAIYKSTEKLGTVEDRGEEVVIQGGEGFEAFVRNLRRGQNAQAFVQNLPRRLKSVIYAREER